MEPLLRNSRIFFLSSEEHSQQELDFSIPLLDIVLLKPGTTWFESRAERIKGSSAHRPTCLPEVFLERLKNLLGRHFQLSGIDKEGCPPQPGVDPGIEPC